VGAKHFNDGLLLRIGGAFEKAVAGKTLWSRAGLRYGAAWIKEIREQ
jgi:hypothetical protein